MKEIDCHSIDDKVEKCHYCGELCENPMWACIDDEKVLIRPICRDCGEKTCKDCIFSSKFEYKEFYCSSNNAVYEIKGGICKFFKPKKDE